MGAEGLDDDDEVVFRAPPPPDDRLWRHPAELGAARAHAPALPPTTRARRRRPATALVVLASAIGGAVVASAVLFAFNGFDSTTVRVTERVALTPVVASTPGNAPTDDWAAAVAAPTIDSVVLVEAGSGATTRQASGVVFADDGHVLTTAHAVRDASAVRVRAGSLTLPARVVGIDEVTDLAVLHVDGALGVSPAVFAPRPATPRGTVVALVGALADDTPQARATTVRATDVGADVGGNELHALVELATDAAAIEEGGAVLNASGAVVALVQSGTHRGDTAYATPIDIVHRVADQIVREGRASHPWLGVVGSDITPRQAESAGVDKGAAVDQVSSSSPASGVLEPGDVVTALNGRPVTSMESLIGAVRRMQPGATVTLTYVRGSATETAAVTLQARAGSS